jgi:hypothetical protein
MKKSLVAVLGVSALVMTGWMTNSGNAVNAENDVDARIHSSRVKQGFKIAPVPLNLKHKNRAWVGEGSYLVNAVGSCNDCHTCPSYAPDTLTHTNNPYAGGPGLLNTNNYLAGGVAFGPFVSANLTPDQTGKPAGMTRDEFIQTLRTGQHMGETLQVMPWPILRNMTDRDLRSIYEYLSAIPHAEPGTNCTGPGQ